VLLFVDKLIHHPEMLPVTFINNKFITFNEEVHKYKTRIKSNIHLYQSSTSAGLRSVNEVTKPLYN